MKTSEQWWQEVSNDPEKLNNWLKNQYHGERTAATRISGLVQTHAGISFSYRQTLIAIADQEAKHAQWVADLLVARGIEPAVLDKESRYWDKTLPSVEASFEEVCAVGHHAEKMRLERIRVIAKDTQHPDIAEVFAKILPEEEFHERAFASMSDPVSIKNAESNHRAGLNALGLVH